MECHPPTFLVTFLIFFLCRSLKSYELKREVNSTYTVCSSFLKVSDMVKQSRSTICPSVQKDFGITAFFFLVAFYCLHWN